MGTYILLPYSNIKILVYLRLTFQDFLFNLTLRHLRQTVHQKDPASGATVLDYNVRNLLASKTNAKG